MSNQEIVAVPRYADTVVVGGGTSGAVLAGRLAEGGDRSVLLLEAGPDYGSFARGAWPQGLLDGRTMPVKEHDWRYTSAAQYGRPDLKLQRARVLGGCSAHNGCAAIWGSHVDYDNWEALGNPGWGTADLLPYFKAGSERMRVRKPRDGEVTPFHRAILAGAPGAGIPVVEDLNDIYQDVGISASPVNVWNGVRWNAAFAYLDPVRDRPQLTICGNLLVDRVELGQGRISGVVAISPDGPAHIAANQVVLCAGAYGSPAILLRSGVGEPDDLRALGVEPRHALPGVGNNLHDHPAISLYYAGSTELVAALEGFVQAGGWLCEEQTIAKLRSTQCREAFDLHIYPVASPYWNDDGSWQFQFPVSTMTPRSRGKVRLTSSDAEAAPLLDHGYLTDPEGHDLAVLLDGIEMARALTGQSQLAELLGPEITPGASVQSKADLAAFVRSNCEHYYHPVGSCKMGPGTDAMAVVDASGAVHGLEGLYVADASIMPVIPRANTNMPCVVIGEKIAEQLRRHRFT